ncbi:DUF6538 domain-containing protein [Bradyrhizobium sp. WSM1743]|uniref:DUF6538 domain-containing protein n=1 Tax=Bradyrhizobium sp. WSM1743 TaxID=318996 RepID=UPI00041C6B92|nr:DUF6538 domain-containing protein [Bradyrhizobium sp. WSM1743]
MPTIKMPKPIKRPTSANYWIRKKVPSDLRPLVGKTEIWASLGTSKDREATIKIARRERENRGRMGPAAGRENATPVAADAFVPEPFKLTHQDLHALRKEEHTRISDHWMKEPPTGFAKLRMGHTADEESLQLDAIDLLQGGGYEASPANVARLMPLLVQPRREAVSDVEHARVGEYDKIANLVNIRNRETGRASPQILQSTCSRSMPML